MESTTVYFQVTSHSQANTVLYHLKDYYGRNIVDGFLAMKFVQATSHFQQPQYGVSETNRVRKR